MKGLLSILFLAFTVCLYSQLVTSTAQSPQNLVQNVLLGEGVQVSNINYTGDIQAIGSFTYAGTFMGITNGIVITTGTVFNNGNGPQGPNNAEGSGVDNSGGSVQILEGLIPQTQNTFNGAVLEFDFTAVGDIISFNYVFGSEEYLEYVGADYNDVFGLFISGPGIVGQQNIARLPNNQVVSIDNVNNTSNAAFYVNNGTGNQGPFNANPQYIQYDGYTQVLTAQAEVQCGGTYHLIIAIADVGDGIYDSGVFLEAQSLSSQAPVEITYETSNIFFGDPTIVAEGCTSATFTFSRTNTEEALNVPITVSGTATPLLDFSAIPNALNFAPGQASIDFTFDALIDQVDDDDETVVITFTVTDPCGDTYEVDYPFTIRQVEPISVDIETDSIFCNDGPVTITPTLAGGLEPITYLWSTNETSPTITVNPSQTTTYWLRVTDFCLNSTASDTADIVIVELAPIVIEPISDLNENCPFVENTIVPVVSGGGGQFQYIWSVNNQPINLTQNLTVSPSETTTYDLLVTDQCGLNATTSFDINVNIQPLIASIAPIEPICPGDSVLLTASASLGFGLYQYNWLHGNFTSESVWVKPAVNTSYTVAVSDECQTYSSNAIINVIVREPLARFSISSSDYNINSPVNFFNLSPSYVSLEWNLGDGTFSTQDNPSHKYSDFGDYQIELIITDEYGCKDTAYNTVNIGVVLYFPNTFTPDGNRLNNTFRATSTNTTILSVEIFNRWGELIYFSENDDDFQWDGTYNGKDCPDGVYTYKIRYQPRNQKEELKLGHVNILR